MGSGCYSKLKQTIVMIRTRMFGSEEEEEEYDDEHESVVTTTPQITIINETPPAAVVMNPLVRGISSQLDRGGGGGHILSIPADIMAGDPHLYSRDSFSCYPTAAVSSPCDVLILSFLHDDMVERVGAPEIVYSPTNAASSRLAWGGSHRPNSETNSNTSHTPSEPQLDGNTSPRTLTFQVSDDQFNLAAFEPVTQLQQDRIQEQKNTSISLNLLNMHFSSQYGANTVHSSSVEAVVIAQNHV